VVWITARNVSRRVGGKSDNRWHAPLVFGDGDQKEKEGKNKNNNQLSLGRSLRAQTEGETYIEPPKNNFGTKAE